MDLLSFVAVCSIFTLFGYVWGTFASKDFNKQRVARIVSATMDSLEKDGFLRSETIKGEPHYIKWPDHNEKDL
jgi:hypothetical protein